MTRDAGFRIVGGLTPSGPLLSIGADEAGKFQAFIPEGVTATNVDISAYRMETQGACWNLGVEGDSLDGMCVGARLIALHAVRE